MSKKRVKMMELEGVNASGLSRYDYRFFMKKLLTLRPVCDNIRVTYMAEKTAACDRICMKPLGKVKVNACGS
jgi:hypothetical protein